jgi:hypothetical protein
MMTSLLLALENIEALLWFVLITSMMTSLLLALEHRGAARVCTDYIHDDQSVVGA